jgi:protein-disulfide isomerase
MLKTPVSGSDHRQGSANALITLVEFGDYECPYCKDAYWLVKELKVNYLEQLQLVFRNFPLTNIHSHALTAAITAEFAGAQGLFWDAHDELYENQSPLSWALFETIVIKVNLSPADLRKAVDERLFNPRIQADFNSGVRSGVNGTPCFYLNSVRYDGPIGLSEMSNAIESILGSTHVRA